MSNELPTSNRQLEARNTSNACEPSSNTLDERESHASGDVDRRPHVGRPLTEDEDTRSNDDSPVVHTKDVDERAETTTPSGTARVDERRLTLYKGAATTIQYQDNIDSSSAFNILDKQFRNGNLSGVRAAQLKSQFTHLYELWKCSRENEMRLVMEVAEGSRKIAEQNELLEKADNFPESNETEVSKLREKLLQKTNEHDEKIEKLYQLQYRYAGMKEEKRLVDKEYQRLPKQADVEKRHEELVASRDEVAKLISQRKIEAEKLKEDLGKQERQVELIRKELMKREEGLDKIKGDLVAVNMIPSQINKESDRLEKLQMELEREQVEMSKNFQSVTEKLKELKESQENVEQQKEQLDVKAGRELAALNEKARSLQKQMKEYEYLKEREIVLRDDRTTLDLNLRSIAQDIRHSVESQGRSYRNRDRALRRLKRAELELQNANEAINSGMKTCESLRTQKLAFPIIDPEGENKEQFGRDKLGKASLGLSKQHGLTAEKMVRMENTVVQEEMLMNELHDLRITVVELQRFSQIKNDEREQMQRDQIRAAQRYREAQKMLKFKQLQITEHEKKQQQVQVRLLDFAKLYETIKNERNKMVNMIQTSSHKTSEMTEKTKILQNEIEILRTTAMQRERQLQAERLRFVSMVTNREQMQSELTKLERGHAKLLETMEQLRSSTRSYSTISCKFEEEQLRLQKRFEETTKRRNERGIQLVERDEEVCIFIEKTNLQENLVRNANIDMKEKEEEIKFLKMELCEEERAIQLLKKQIPNKNLLENEIVNQQIELSRVQQELIVLESKTHDAEGTGRARLLKGNVMPEEEIKEKLEKVEMRLADTEVQLLEKELVGEQLEKLVSKAQQKFESSKEETLALAKDVNEIQFRIQEASKKMKAFVSELCMQQANALTFAHQVKMKESELEQICVQVESGEPLSKKATSHGQEINKVKTSVHSSALREGRPQGYVDLDDPKQGSRPFGKFAPFKPSTAGSSMRHIRKPRPKPIEI